MQSADNRITRLDNSLSLLLKRHYTNNIFNGLCQNLNTRSYCRRRTKFFKELRSFVELLEVVPNFSQFSHHLFLNLFRYFTYFSKTRQTTKTSKRLSSNYCCFLKIFLIFFKAFGRWQSSNNFFPKFYYIFACCCPIFYSYFASKRMFSILPSSSDR